MARRDSPRFPITAPVVCIFDGKTVNAESVNVSRAGLLLVGADLPPVGSRIKIRITLTQEFEIEGVVRHLVYGCGVQVISMPPEHQAKWNAYLDRLADLVAQSLSQPE